eukprot:TRINITY_DN713_c0_g1_i3.p2 TRINITY_DN713_c0_g1~~TRINITY_DN713_c0_g1_i3.p2  ORF type:complete len:458 (+),score=162.99 TRINITY_DN713_c0_g1_i3:703-2076(+)
MMVLYLGKENRLCQSLNNLATYRMRLVDVEADALAMVKDAATYPDDDKYRVDVIIIDSTFTNINPQLMLGTLEPRKCWQTRRVFVVVPQITNDAIKLWCNQLGAAGCIDLNGSGMQANNQIVNSLQSLHLIRLVTTENDTLDHLAERVDTLSNENEDLHIRQELLQRNLEHLANMQVSTEKSHKKVVDALESELYERQQTIETLRVKLTDERLSLNQLEADYADLKADFDEMMAAEGQVQLQIRSFHSQLKDRDREINSLFDQIDSGKRVAIELQAKNEMLVKLMASMMISNPNTDREAYDAAKEILEQAEGMLESMDVDDDMKDYLLDRYTRRIEFQDIERDLPDELLNPENLLTVGEYVSKRIQDTLKKRQSKESHVSSVIGYEFMRRWDFNMWDFAQEQQTLLVGEMFKDFGLPTRFQFSHKQLLNLVESLRQSLVYFISHSITAKAYILYYLV